MNYLLYITTTHLWFGGWFLIVLPHFSYGNNTKPRFVFFCFRFTGGGTETCICDSIRGQKETMRHLCMWTLGTDTLLRCSSLFDGWIVLQLMLFLAGCKEFPELEWNGPNVCSSCLAQRDATGLIGRLDIVIHSGTGRVTHCQDQRMS